MDADKGPVTYHQDGELTVVLQANEQQAQQAERERLAEDMRKLYVALTRAPALLLGRADAGERAKCYRVLCYPTMRWYRLWLCWSSYRLY